MFGIFSLLKSLNFKADSSLRVGTGSISFLAWQWGSSRKQSGTRRHRASRYCKQFANMLKFMHYEIINFAPHIQRIHWQTTWEFYFWNNVFFRSLRDIEQPLVVLCIFPCPSDVTKPPAALSYWKITWFICRERAAHIQRIIWLFVSIL